MEENQATAGLAADYEGSTPRLQETSKPLTTEQVAEICHEANRVYCKILGDDSQDFWSAAPDWQKDSTIKGVKFHLENPEAEASASHAKWMEQKLNDGWVYGPIKDSEKKEHPCIVHFENLPKAQQVKDFLFRGIVHAVAQFV